MNEPWRIELFGGLKAEQEDREITRFRTQKFGILFAYLAYYLGQNHPREALIEMLWPEVEPVIGRDRLSTALSSLRHQLEPPGVPAGAVLIADRFRVRLNPDVIRTDVMAFEAVLDVPQASSNPVERMRFLTQALDLYKGPLLPGYYEEWVSRERERLAETYLGALRQMMRLLVQQRDLGRATDYARRAIQVDPLREEAHRDLMHLLIATNQPSAALRQYRELEQLLETTLGQKPSAPIRALVRQLHAAQEEEQEEEQPLKSLRPHVSSDAPPDSLSSSPIDSTLSLPTGRKGSPTQGEQTDHVVRADRAEQHDLPRQEARRSQLPLRFTRFFGRKAEIARMVERLLPYAGTLSETERADPGAPARLLTLSGPGGAGKTRLALEVAERLVEAFEGAVWFVPLADVTEARLIAGAVVDAMRIPRSPQQEPMEQAVEALSRQPALLVLDNFEQLVADGAAVVRTLLEQTPQLTCLITSRQLLGLTGEREWSIPPLSTPHGAVIPEQVTLFESVQLFVDRAQTVRPDFQVTQNNASAVAELCDRLEGLPLALELAAARAQVLTPMQMLAQLERRFDFLVSRKRDVAERHRTLRAAIEWSYHLLTPELQQFFVQLSVFRGGWSLEAAERVCEAGEPLGLGPGPGMALDYLAQLRECSLIRTEERGSEIRFRMLETLREFGLQHGSAEERRRLEMRHRDYFLNLAETADSHLKGEEQAKWLNILESEHDNLGAALEACRMDPETADPGLRLSAALYTFWWGRGHIQEGRERLAIALAHPKATADIARAKALHHAGDLARRQGDYPTARKLLEEQLAICRACHHAQGIAHALGNLGLLASTQGDHLQAKSLLEEALTIQKESGDTTGTARAFYNLGCVVEAQGESGYAVILFEEALALWRDLHDTLGMSMVLVNLGHIKLSAEAYDAARQLFEEGLALQQDLGMKELIAIILLNLALIARQNGEVAVSENHLAESLGILLAMGDRRSIAWALEMTARWRANQNLPERAARLLGRAKTLRESLGQPLGLQEVAAHETLLRDLHTALEAKKFAACWEEGSALTLEQAVAYALEGADTLGGL